MELLFEIIFSIIFEGSFEGMKTKKLPIGLRIVCAIIVSLVFLFVIGIIAFIAISIWSEYYHIPSISLFFIDCIFIVFALKEFKKTKLK